MCVEAFDETVIQEIVVGLKQIFVRGGYSRDEVCIGIGKLGGLDPDVLIEVDGAELKRALRKMVIGDHRRRKKKR